MKFSEMYEGESKYLSKKDLPAPRVVTIANVYQETVKSQHGSKQECLVSFTDAGIKPLILNTTNGNTIMYAYGDDPNLLRGKVIELYHDPNVEYPAGTRVGGVRVRIPSSNAPAQQPAPSPGATADNWTYQQALDAVVVAGGTADMLKSRLKGLGMTTWSDDPAKGTAEARVLISSLTATVGEAGDEIPF